MRKILLLLLFVAVNGCAKVEDGQVGIKMDLGHIKDAPLGAGFHTFNPFLGWVEVWNVKTQELKETANVPSSEGLISQLDVSILYFVSKENAVRVRKEIGAEDEYVSTVLKPYVREAIRNVASGYAVKSLYSDAGRKEIGQKMIDFLKSKLDSKGINIQDVLLRDVRLPATFSQSIEAKLKAEQESLQKEFELQKAQKDAEIEIARAKGTAQSNLIVGGSITPGYLKYLWIQGMQTNQMQVVYVPTEANLPILESGRWQEYEEFSKKKA